MDESEKLSQAMMWCGLATGHGDTFDDLLEEMKLQFKQQADEIERLREALRKIAAYSSNPSMIARAALKGDE
jgi:hypothetical protein